MPWELTIRRRDGQPLGPADAVRSHIEAAFPSVRFYREPSGPEKIAAAARAGISFPPFLVEHMQLQPAAEQADLDGDGFSVRLFLGSEPVVASVAVEVRGDGLRAEPLLRGLARRTGWGIDQLGLRGVEPLM